MEQVSSPNKKLTVKRNLNDSFNNSSSSYIEPCALNYSLIDNASDNETPLVLKLRKSKNQHLYVNIEKLNSETLEQNLNNRNLSINLKRLEKEKLNSVLDKTLDKIEYISSDDDKSDSNIKLKTEIVLRRSSRKKNRISYADYLSPIKTPSKRNRKVSTDSDSSVVINTKTLKNSEYSTPSKNNYVCVSKHSKFKSSSRKLNNTPITKVETTESSDDEIKIKKGSQKIHDASFVANKLKDSYVKLETPIKDKKVSLTSKCIELQTPVKNKPKRISKPPARYCEEESPTKKKKAETSKQDEEESMECINNCRYSRSIISTSNLKIHNLDNCISPHKENNKLKSISNKNHISRKSIHKTDELHDISINHQYELQTPVKSMQFLQKMQTPKSTTKNTPSMKAKLIRDGVITPSVQMRSTPIKAASTPLNTARTKLHVSYMPKVLPCREKEYNDVFNFLEGKLLDGCGGCMYVSGVPGTGKTATITDVIRKLEEKSKKGIVPKFQFISVNGMRLSEPRQSYVEIFKQLTGKTVFWEQAQSALDNQFTKPRKKSMPIIMLVDELDILCTKRQDVVYNLLDWPTKASVQLIVITIANTMDLPERLLMGRVTSRLGLTRLTFQAYTHKQLQEIVTMRLMGTKIFNPDAVQLVARKVASVSGDARRALDICRRAAEIAELESPNTLVSMTHVNEALNAMITQPKVKAIKHCSKLQQLILQAIAAEIERTGVEETTFADVYTMFESIAAIDGFRTVSCTLALAAVSHLGACRLLLTDQKSNDFHQKLILNVSTDDVYYALRKE